MHRRRVQRGTRRTRGRDGPDAAADRVTGRVPSATGPWPAAESWQGRPNGHRFHRQPPQLPHQATHAARARNGTAGGHRQGPAGHADGQFCLPPGCSATYDVELVDILRATARVGARSALEDYCRSYADERGRRPSAIQAYQAGYNPASARGEHGHWFAFLDDLGLLDERERAVVRRHGDVLDGFEKEPITKSYKLVTLQALLQMNALRTGA